MFLKNYWHLFHVEEPPGESGVAGRPHTYWPHQSSLREKAKIQNIPRSIEIVVFFTLLLTLGDGHFFHAMRWRCFIFYNDAISIIF